MGSAEATTHDSDFYVRAKEAMEAGTLNQELEDELDQLMAEEDDEEDEIENVLFGDDAVVSAKLKTHVLPSEFTEFAIRIPVGGEVVRFNFKDRDYLRQIYNTPARRTLLKCARQCEKSCRETSYVHLHDGSLRTIKDIEVGDRVIALSADGSHTTVGTVTWKSRRYKKPCLRINTIQNLAAEVATTHPMRLWGRWAPAQELRVGDRLGSLRKGGVFTATAGIPDDHIKFAAYMIGDGCCGCSGNFAFTQADGPCLLEFEELASSAGWATRCRLRVKSSRTFQVSLGQAADSEPRRLLEEWGLWGLHSQEKHFPTWVWDLNYEQSALFLNRLWATDGSVKCHQRAQYEIVYSSISYRLVKDVQRLLWKFGIPSRIRENKPTLYKDTNKVAYILHIRTQPGITVFLTKIGALGKSNGVPLPSVKPNSNRDTYPSEINEDIREIIRSRGSVGRFGRCARSSLRSAGLRETLEYPPSRQKLQNYINFFRENAEYDQQLVDRLAQHLDTDLYWDRVRSVEDLGEQWCYDISVDEGESFVVDGLITHNSTMLGNKAIAYCGVNYGFKVLYVSATATQATVFSVDRLKEPIDISPELSYLIDSRLSQNVLFKQFKNRSQIRIRYAFLNADRTRGIPGDMIQIDEIQDIIFQNVPVIEQCASHSSWKLFCYSGTPKSMDNTIETYWSEFSTQNEWAVPCEACGGKSPDSWYWNILGRGNIGKKGPVCAKCKRPINPAHPHAQWVSLQPIDRDNAHRVAFEGYRINQLMVPWIVNDPSGWSDSVLFALENYDSAKFNNEVMGLSYDGGQRPLTKNQVEACCQEGIHMYDEDIVLRTAAKCYGGVAAGLDHGTGENESYSVLSLGGYLGGQFQIFYIHRFTGEDLNPALQLLKIAALLKQVNFIVLGSDYGGGFDRNDWLMRNFGPHKVMKYQYAGGPKKKIKWEPELGRFMLHRTEVMSDIFNAIRQRKIWLPNFEEFRTPYAGDLLNIFSEFNEQIHMTQYKVSPGKSDDSFHSILYCFLASMFIKARPDIIVPTSPGHVDFTND